MDIWLRNCKYSDNWRKWTVRFNMCIRVLLVAIEWV